MIEQLKEHALVKPDDQKWLRSIGLYQMIGGALGYIVFFIFSFFTAGFNLLLLPAFLFFGLSVYAGLQCYALKDNCLKVTFLNQALQLMSLVAGSFSFRYVSGLSLEPYLSLSDGFSLGIHFNISSFGYKIGGEQGYSCGVNLIALAVLYKIIDIRSNMKTALWRKEVESQNQKLSHDRNDQLV